MKIYMIIALSTLLVSGCTYYQAVPGGTYTTSNPGKFERSWSAAIGAFSDQGIGISRQDRGTGVITGSRDGINVTGNIRTQADGSVRVQFDTSGATKRDPTLIQRITDSYNRRMGR